MIERPSDIIYHIVGGELEKGSGVIDTTVTNGQTGLDRARANHPDWKMAFTQNRTINSKKLIEGIAKESKLFPFFKGDKLSFNSIQDSYDSADFEIKRDDVISIKFDRTKIDDVRTKVVLHYHYDYATDEYPKSTFNNVEADTAEEFFSTNGYQNSYLGIEGEQGDDPIEVKYIRHQEGVAFPDQTIAKLQRFLLSWYCNQHNLCSVRLPLRYLYAEVGDIVAFDREVNDNLQYGEGYSLYYRTNISVTVRNGQEILPYFLCTEVKKSLEYVEMKLIQLHSQDDEITNVAPIANAGGNQSVFYGETVHLNGAGSYDPDGDPITYIWSGDTYLYDAGQVSPYFTAGQDDSTLNFYLTVTDSEGNESLPDSCTVIVAGDAPLTHMQLVTYETIPEWWEESGFPPLNSTGSLLNATDTYALFDYTDQGFLPIFINNPDGLAWYIKFPRYFPNYPTGSYTGFYGVSTPDQSLMTPGATTTSQFAMLKVDFNAYIATRHSSDGYWNSGDTIPYPDITFHFVDGDAQFGAIRFDQNSNPDGEWFPPAPPGWGEGRPPGAVGAWSLLEEIGEGTEQ